MLNNGFKLMYVFEVLLNIDSLEIRIVTYLYFMYGAQIVYLFIGVNSVTMAFTIK